MKTLSAEIGIAQTFALLGVVYLSPSFCCEQAAFRLRYGGDSQVPIFSKVEG
jgi:hypothetical protein